MQLCAIIYWIAIVMDVDGSMTDGKIYMGINGEVFKAFDIKDGYGIHTIIPSLGIEPIVITGRCSEIVKNRCDELGIKKVYQGVSDKLSKLIEITSGNFSEVAYFGDDINDISCMIKVKRANGITGCPSDAIKEVKKSVDYISTKIGGSGAIREFIEWIIHEGASVSGEDISNDV